MIRRSTKTAIAMTLLLSSVLSNAADKVVATYNNQDIKESQILPYLETVSAAPTPFKGQSFENLKFDIQEYLIKQYIINNLLDNATKDAKLESSDDVKKKVAAAKRQILIEELLKSKVESSVTDAAIDEAYNKFSKEYANKQQVKISHILLATQEKANEIKAKLKKGIKFETLAKESLDENSKDNGGVIAQYILQGTTFPAFEEKVFAMKVGEISDPIQTPMGWEIIKLNDKQAFKVPKKEDMKDSLVSNLNNVAADKYISSLYQNANVKINTENLSKPEKAPEAPAMKPVAKK